MASLYRPKTLALTKLANLPKYRHPADFIHEFKKPIGIQNREINGEVQFEKGLYHNNYYQKLMKSVKQTRQQFRIAQSIQRRKQIATQQFNFWDQYLKNHVAELPQNKLINQKHRNQLYEAYLTAKQRNQQKIACSRLLHFHNQYAKAFTMDIQIHPKMLLQMIHPHFGYLLLYKHKITLEQLIEFYHNMLVASEQRYIGQSLHSEQISALTFWKLYTKQPYLSVNDFCQMLKCFKFSVSLNEFEKQFKYSLNKFKGQISRDHPLQKQIIRFDYFRYIFLERNL